MLKLRKVLVLLVILLLLVGIAVQVQASDLIDLGNLITDGNTTENATTNTTQNTVANSTLNVTTNTASNTTTNTAGNSVVQPSTNRAGSSENNLPQTGVTEDITVMFFIIVCVIAAIYAYKKIRDYRS